MLKIWRANYGASRAWLGGWVGGGYAVLIVSRPPCPPVPSVLRWGLPRPPVPCVGLSPCKWTTILYGVGKWLYGLLIGLYGAIVKPPACVPCQERDKGRKFSYLLPVLCTSFVPVPSVANFQLSGTQKKKRPFIWSFLLGLYGVSPVAWIRLIVSKHC